jgi:hypothetical protein
MRLPLAVLLIPLALAAEAPPEADYVRGTLLECEPGADTGQFSVRTAANAVYRYRYDGRSWIERERERIQGAALRPGEQVEVVADGGPANTLRYARTVHVIEPAPPPRPLSAGRYRADRTPAESLAPLGTMTFAGVVARVNHELLVLRLRGTALQIILLRPDTRFLESGAVVDGAGLLPNTRVFVRAGKGLYGEIEAYQVIWGEILRPNLP